MIQIRIKKHSSQSLQLKLGFPSVSFLQKKNNYGMDMYLFLPPTLGVNKHTYSSGDFYKSLKSYIRLSTPSVDFNSCIDEKSNFWQQLYDDISHAQLLPDKKTQNKLISIIKHHVVVVKESIQLEIKRMLLIRNYEEQTVEIEVFVQGYYAIREMQKKVFAHIARLKLSEKVTMATRFADEYQSLMTERLMFELMNGLPQEDDIATPVKSKLDKLVLDEMKYRKKMKYPSVANNNKVVESVLHREGRLKRYIESVLFLTINTRKEGVFYEQFFLSLAAGLAMIFATSVVFATQMIFDALTLQFFIILVVSYMFKDRIKEQTRMFFDKRRRKSFFDFRTIISSQENPKIGVVKEGFGFESQKYIPPEIKTAREKIRATEIPEEWMEDKVILYKTKITINKSSGLKSFRGISQILRFDISPFTTKMDDHEKEVFVKAKKNLTRHVVNHVYHLNLILRFYEGKKITYRYYKLICDKRGIKRINHCNVDGS